MLYKPSFPVPCNTSVDASDNIKFSATCLNTDTVVKSTLILRDNFKEYYFPFDTFNSVDGAGKSENEIYFSINKNTIYNGYSIYDRNNSTNNTIYRTEIESNICGDGSKILSNRFSYSWQARLYQTQCDINIAYGFVQDIYNISEDDIDTRYVYNAEATHIIKVRPHTNIQFNAKNQYINNDISDIYYEYYDNNVKYQIFINGSYYDILGYYYSSDNFEGNIDSYGNPLFAYIEVMLDDGSIIENNTDYSIYTNYIDSNEIYFRCVSKPMLKLYYGSISTGNEIDSDVNNIENNSFEINSSNFSIEGEYSSDDNMSVNYYNCKLYRVRNGEEFLIDKTDDIYSTNILYNYNLMLNDNIYKFSIEVVDNDRERISRAFYIVPNYASVAIPRNLDIGYYDANKSIIIDFDDVISISGAEKNVGEHKFLNLVVGKTTGKIYADETTQILSEIEEETVDVPSCYINRGNSIIYGDSSKANQLECSEPLLSTVFKCNSYGIQKIIEMTDDNNNYYYIQWESMKFVIYYKAYNSNIISSFSYVPFNTISENNTNELIYDIERILSTNELNYSIPCLALENITTNDKYYVHTEEITHDFWWQIIWKGGMSFYIKCLNPPNGHGWEFESSDVK